MKGWAKNSNRHFRNENIKKAIRAIKRWAISSAKCRSKPQLDATACHNY